MTSITVSEIKIVFFALFFIGILGAFMTIYNLSPITPNSYTGNMSFTNQSTSTQDSWISGLIKSVYPAPFNDPITALVLTIILVPVATMLVYVSIRAIKDLVSQWI